MNTWKNFSRSLTGEIGGLNITMNDGRKATLGEKKLEYKKSYRHFRRFQDIREISWTEKFGSIEARCISSLSWICASLEFFISSVALLWTVLPNESTQLKTKFDWQHVRTPFRCRCVTRHVLHRYCHCELNRNENCAKRIKKCASLSLPSLLDMRKQFFFSI